MAVHQRHKSFRRRFGKFLRGMNPAMADRVRRFRSRFPKPGVLPLAERQATAIVSRLVGMFYSLFREAKSRCVRGGSGMLTRFAPRVEALEARQMLTALYVAPVWTVVPGGGHSPSNGDHVQYTAAGHDTVPATGTLTYGTNAFSTISSAVTAANSGDSV